MSEDRMTGLNVTLPRPQPTPLAVPRPRTPSAGRLFALSLTTGVLLWLCYFPVACGWLVWIALVPLLTSVRNAARPRWIYLSAWLGGLAFDLAAIQWMRVADPRMYATWIGLAIYCSLYFPLAIYLIRILDRRTRLPLVLTVPLVWTALEFLRSTFGGGFSWYLLAHSQHAFLPIIQIADVTGAYGVSFLIAAVNALVVQALQTDLRNRRYGLLLSAMAVLIALLGVVGYGFWRLGQEEAKPGPRIALIQGNLDQRIRNASAVSDDAAERVGTHFRDLADLAASYRPDLIVWPETSWPYDWREEDGAPDAASRKMAKDMAARWHTPMLLGMNASNVVDGKPRRYNTALALDGAGAAAGRYDKIHRVPFGEYVPLADWLPFMNYFAPYDFDYSVWPGQAHTRFPLGDAAKPKSTFGVLICYEDTDAEVAHSYGGGGANAVDFLLNISNDGWFDGTSEHNEHLAVCRFRAVECRRAVARSVNMGISAVIDGNGRVLQPRELPRPDPRVNPAFHIWLASRQNDATELPVAQWRDYKKVAGVLLAVVPLDERVSLYARWGDWLPWSCWLILAGVLVLTWLRRRGTKPALP
jgi:apolipoprotein N-acyltransferase